MKYLAQTALIVALFVVAACADDREAEREAFKVYKARPYIDRSSRSLRHESI